MDLEGVVKGKPLSWGNYSGLLGGLQITRSILQRRDECRRVSVQGDTRSGAEVGMLWTKLWTKVCRRPLIKARWSFLSGAYRNAICCHFTFNLLRHSSDFWHSEWEDNEFVVFFLFFSASIDNQCSEFGFEHFIENAICHLVSDASGGRHFFLLT